MTTKPRSTKTKSMNGSPTTAEKIREYRKNNPDYAKRERQKSLAQSRAKSRLAKTYNKLYRKIYAEELAKIEREETTT